MEDLIRRSDAVANIEILLDDISDIQDEDELKEIKAYNLGVQVSLNSIKHHVPSADRWMPCSERLPKRQGHYICTCKDGSKYKRTTVVKWSNGWQLTGTRSYWIVLAWMPLPEPWEGVDDGKDIQSEVE